MTDKSFDLCASALDYVAALKSESDGDAGAVADHARVNLELAALRYAERFAADCEADTLPPAQGDNFDDCAFG